MNEQSSVIFPWGISFSSLINTQESEGSMLVQDHSVLSGVASTVQNYTYKDDKGCYNRIVIAKVGQLLVDNWSNACLEPL